MAAGIHPSALVGRDVVWLLTVTFAGRAFRFASTACDLTDADGNVYTFDGSLDDIDYADAFDLFSDTPAIKSVPFELLFPVDVAELVALGHDLAAATGEFSMVASGGGYDDRVVLVTSRLMDPEHGDADEVVAFSLEENVFEDAALMPDGDAVVIAGATWDNPDAAAEGAIYPFVFGNPGAFVDPDGTAGTRSGSPGLYVDTVNQLILVAGHDTEAADGATTATVWNSTAGNAESFTVTTTTDLAGRVVSVVDVSAAASMTVATGAEYWVTWPNGGGARSPRRTGTLSGAGDLLAYLMSLSTCRIDRGRFASAAAYLNRFEVGGYIDERVSPWEWCRDNLLPLLPVSLATGPGGVYPIVWRYDATGGAVAELVEGQGLVRTGPVRYEGRDALCNELSISYALRARTGEFVRTRTITGRQEAIGQTDYWSSTHARASYARYGLRADTLETDIVYATTTADLVLAWRILAYGFVRRVVTFEADNRYAFLSKGDVVSLMSSRLHLTNQAAIVRDIAWTLAGPSLDIVILEDVVRDLRL